MMQLALGAIVFSPFFTQALLPHVAPPRSMARHTAVGLTMDCQHDLEVCRQQADGSTAR